MMVMLLHSFRLIYIILVTPLERTCPHGTYPSSKTDINTPTYSRKKCLAINYGDKL